MPLLGGGLILLGFSAWGAGLCLPVYLSLRIDSLRRTGDLPPDTPELLGHRWDGRSIEEKIGTIYGRRALMIDAHTRALLPIIRVAMPLGLALLAIGCWTSAAG